MKDVAERLGISISTVSRVLNDKPGVARSTRDLVLAEVETLDYVVSPAASALASGRTGRVCVLVPRVDAWFYSSVIAGVEETLRKYGREVTLYCLPTAQERADYFRRLPLQHSVDALIAVSFPLDTHALARMRDVAAPFITVASKYPGIPSVTIDDRLAAVQAVGHLIRIGHRRIAMICTMDQDGSSWDADIARAEGYRTALATAGITESAELTVTAPWGVEGGAASMERLLSLESPPTAVFCFSDEVAIGALRTLRRTGVAVPEAMSIISVDDHPMAELMDLTTIAQPARQLGVIAAERIIAALDGRLVDDATLPTHLVARHTTGAPARLDS